MPRVSAFYGVVIYMYWNERVTRWLTSTPTTQGAEPQSRWTGTYLLAAWSLGRFSSSGNGPAFDARRSWLTGNGPGKTRVCSVSHHCRSIVNVSENYLPIVVGVAVVGEHVLRLLFSDGTVGDVDFSAERWTGVLEPLNDPAYFAQVTIDPEAGTIVWPDGVDLAPEPLYELARAHPLAAA